MKMLQFGKHFDSHYSLSDYYLVSLPSQFVKCWVGLILLLRLLFLLLFLRLFLRLFLLLLHSVSFC